ncbi:lact-2, partial [Symbiodinium microadriaticum]
HVLAGPVGNVLLMELPLARAALQRGVDEGLHYGAQLAVIFRGEAASVCVGEASEGRPLAEDAVLCWSSSVKPLMAIALGLLQERGRLSFEDPVAKHLPAFAKEGKADITLRHCLTHTAGLFASTMEGQPRLREDAPPDEVLRHICDQPTAEGWQLGRRCAYDSPAWYVMSGVVTAADPQHRAYEKFVEEEIFSPLGMSSCSIGMQPERRARLESSDLLAPLYLRGPRAPPWRILPEEKNRRKVEYPCPAGNGRGPAKELAALYASLLPGAPGPLLQA